MKYKDPQRRRIESGAVIHVDEVDTDSLKTYPGFTGSRLRQGDILETHGLGTAELMDTNGLHKVDSTCGTTTSSADGSTVIRTGTDWRYSPSANTSAGSEDSMVTDFVWV